MYNSDGTLRVKLQRKPAPQSGLSLGWGADASKENCSAASNSPTASPKAAGVKSKVTSIRGSDSPLKSKSRPGSDVRAKQNQGSLTFKEATSKQEAGDSMSHRDVSDTKKKALYNSRVFGDSEAAPQPPTNEMSQLKLREIAGHDIFNQTDAQEEPKRALLGGVRKAPGGGSSLSMKDLHPGSPKTVADAEPEGEKPQGPHPGGKASFGFGW